MANIVRLKRTGIPERHPAVGALTSGELALNTFDGRIFMEKDIGTGNNEIVEFAPLLDQSRVETIVVQSTALQDTFILETKPISRDHVLLYIDGISQSFNTYSVSGKIVTLADPLPIGVQVQIFNFKETSPLGGAGVEIKEYLTTGIQSSFSLDNTPISARFVLVSVGGVVQSTSEYTISGNDVVIGGGVPLGIEVRLINFYEEVTDTNVVAIEALEILTYEGQTVFQLVQQPSGEKSILLSISGIMQTEDDFWIENGNDVILDTALPAGEVVKLFSLRRISLNAGQDGGLF